LTFGSRFSVWHSALGWCRGVVMAFQFGTKLERAVQDVRARSRGRSSPTRHSQPSRWKPVFFGVPHFRSIPGTAVVLSVSRPRWWALGTTLSAFWIMVNNSWMQVPVGYVVENGRLRSGRLGPRLSSIRWSWVRFPHMLLGAYLTGAFCVAATGAWYVLRKKVPTPRLKLCWPWAWVSLAVLLPDSALLRTSQR